MNTLVSAWSRYVGRRHLRRTSFRHPATKRALRRQPLRLQMLEDRTLLSTAGWITEFGSPLNDFAQAITTDSAGNIFVAGRMSDPIAQINPTQATSGASFVRKYDPTGNLIWTREAFSGVADEAVGIAADSSGEYVVGDTWGPLPGQTLTGTRDAYIRKYDANGTPLWTREFGTPNGFGYASSVAVNPSGVFVVGTEDVRMYDAAGNLMWTRGLDGGHGLNVAVDASSVYVGGIVAGVSLPGQINAGGFDDAFVRKYDLSGNEIWTHQFGTAGAEAGGFGLAVDASGIYAGGITTGTFPGQTSIPGENICRPYLRKYDAAGSELWTREYSRCPDQTPIFGNIAVDATGIYVAYGDHGFVQKCNLDGTELRVLQWDPPFGLQGNAVVAGSSGVFVAGAMVGSVPGQSNAGGYDAVLASISVPPIVTSPQVRFANGLPYSGASLTEGTLVTMDTTATHLLGSNEPRFNFNYAWSVSKDGQVVGGVNTNGGGQFAIDFVLPDNGTYVISVTATDSEGNTSAPASTILTVSNSDPVVQIQSPVAIAPLGMLFTFGSSVSDAPADVQHGFDYHWSVTQGGAAYQLPAGTIANSSELSFTPSATGNYVISLVVTDKDGAATTTNATVAVTTLDAISLQNAINANASITLQTDPTQINTAVNALNSIVAPIYYVIDPDTFELVPGGVIPVTVTLNLASGSYNDINFNLQPNVTVIVNGVNGSTTVVGHSPALTITSGSVFVNNISFTTATDSPTILMAGGSLTLRNDIVQESTGFTDAAILVTGGSVDLGTDLSPGNNTINVNGSGMPVQSTGPGVVSAVGDTFQSNGTAVNPLISTTLTSSANLALFNQSVTLTATVTAVTSGTGTPTGTVTFYDLTTGVTLGSSRISKGIAQWTGSTLTPGQHAILAVYSGDAKFITSSARLDQSVTNFSGFLAPLSNNLAFNLNRTIPIKWQLGDSTGKVVTDLSAIASLQVAPVLSGGALGMAFNPTPTGGTSLRNDGTQYVFNWDTKGVAVGTYRVVLTLADGTVQTKTLQIVTKGGYAALLVDGSSSIATTGGLLAGDINLYVDNSNGDLTADELARIQDAVTAVDAVTAPYGVAVHEVSDPTMADVMLNMDTTSAVGGYADGVLGCTTDAGQITLIQGWSFYAGSDATQIGSGQYDFQTVVTHELGHALGLGHSADSTSVMYAMLDMGAVKRALSTADLNVPDTDNGACGLHAQQPSLQTVTAMPEIPPGVRALPHGSDARVAVDWLFAGWAGLPAPLRESAAASPLGKSHPTDLLLPADMGRALVPGQSPADSLLTAWETTASTNVSMDLLFADLGQNSEWALWLVSDVPGLASGLQSARV